MAKLNPLSDSDFEAKTYFDQGVHEVVIASVKREDPEGKAPFAAFDVEGTEGQKATVRLYLSPAAAEYSLRTLGQIAVHNKTTDAEKEAVRKAFKAIDDTDKIDDAFLAKFVEMEAWLLTEEDTNGAQKPNGGYYLRSNLYSYPPTPSKAAQASAIITNKDNAPVDPNEIPF